VFIELIDRLRCPNLHAETWLVAAVSRTEQRRLLDATLACPVCDAEFAVRNGSVVFGNGVTSAPMSATDADVLRTAALLHVQERGLYVLDAGWGSLAPALLALVAAEYLLFDPPEGFVAEAGVGVLIGVGERLPLAASSLQGIALERASAARLGDAVRVLKPGGRLVAPASAPVPSGVAELARDEHHWVGERSGDVVSIGRARR